MKFLPDEIIELELLIEGLTELSRLQTNPKKKTDYDNLKRKIIIDNAQLLHEANRF